jgi:hypothetical protein
MRDLIDPDCLRAAVDITMKRYPYFCVELKKKEGQYVFEVGKIHPGVPFACFQTDSGRPEGIYEDGGHQLYRSVSEGFRS